MGADEFDYVALHELRAGLFVDLDLGWMSHPFPSSRFKITNNRQLEVLRGLGVDRIRYVPSKSDPVETPVDAAATEGEDSTAVDFETDRLRVQREQRAAARLAQQESLLQCERRFVESTEQYRKALSLVGSRPAEALKVGEKVVRDMAIEMAAQGDSAIRLLTEAAGDKAAMHPVNVTVLSLLLGKSMGLSEAALRDLGIAAFLHDMGKLNLPERVRRWEEGFSAAENKVYQDHVAQSVAMAREMGLSSGAINVIAQHHEMVDGSGFPARLKQDAIDVGARVLSLVNRYDGLCNPVKMAATMTPHEALAMLFAQQKTRFDGKALSAFIRMMGVYPPGSVVQLNDERHALVVSVNSARPLKPRVLIHEPAVPRHESIVIDLEKAPNTSIRRSLKPSSLPVAAMDYLQPRQRICYFYEAAANGSAANLSA